MVSSLQPALSKPSDFERPTVAEPAMVTSIHYAHLSHNEKVPNVHPEPRLFYHTHFIDKKTITRINSHVVLVIVEPPSRTLDLDQTSYCRSLIFQFFTYQCHSIFSVCPSYRPLWLESVLSLERECPTMRWCVKARPTRTFERSRWPWTKGIKNCLPSCTKARDQYESSPWHIRYGTHSFQQKKPSLTLS